MYSETTQEIKISVDTTFVEEQSEPDDFHFVWAYHIRIENEGGETVQLLRRHWHITDSQGRVHEVRGDGVVGEQPVLEPGEAFEYTSGTPLATPSGFMVRMIAMPLEMEPCSQGTRQDHSAIEFCTVKSGHNEVGDLFRGGRIDFQRASHDRMPISLRLNGGRQCSAVGIGSLFRHSLR